MEKVWIRIMRSKNILVINTRKLIDKHSKTVKLAMAETTVTDILHFLSIKNSLL